MKEDNPNTVTLERAQEIVAEKKIAEANKLVKAFDGTDVQILNGRWGAYITDGNKNAKIPKELKETPAVIDLDTCLKLLAEAPERKGRGKKKAAAKTEAAAKKKATAKKKTQKETRQEEIRQQEEERCQQENRVCGCQCRSQVESVFRDKIDCVV